MTKLHIQRLSQAKRPAYISRYWGEVDPTPIAARVAREIFDDALLLPLTRLSGALVYPVLAAEGVALHDMRDENSPVLRMGFLSVSPVVRAARELHLLSAFGPVSVVVPSTSSPRFFDLAELDIRGIGAHQLVGDEVRVLVPAAKGPHPDSRVPDYWRVERETQLLSLLGSSHTPTLEVCVESQAPRKPGASHGSWVTEAISSIRN